MTMTWVSTAAAALAAGQQQVTWLKLEKPSLDLAGVLLSSLGATVLLAILALAVGVLIGVARVRQARGRDRSALDDVSLRLTPRA